MSENNFYSNKIKEIKKLIKTDLLKAKELLSAELAMPYIPLKYEKQFFELKNVIDNLLNDEKFIKQLDKEEILELLFSNNVEKQLSVIGYLKKMNLRDLKNDLKKWIESSAGSQNKYLRAIIYELLVGQEIDIPLKIENVEINPSKNKSILNNPDVIKWFKKIENRFLKEPHMFEASKNVFFNFLLTSFPVMNPLKTLDFNDFLAVIKRLFDEKIVLSPKQKELQTKLELI